MIKVKGSGGGVNIKNATATPDKVMAPYTFFAGNSREMQTGTFSALSIITGASGSITLNAGASQTITCNNLYAIAIGVFKFYTPSYPDDWECYYDMGSGFSGISNNDSAGYVYVSCTYTRTEQSDGSYTTTITIKNNTTMGPFTYYYRIAGLSRI